LGVQKGANPAALLRDPKRSLRDGAIAAWPSLSEDATFLRFATALAQHLGMSLDTAYEQLEPAQQRAILHGTGEAWIALDPAAAAQGKPTAKFQYKGLLPAVDEASRVSFVYRSQLDQVVSEVPCTACQGSRLRDD